MDAEKTIIRHELLVSRLYYKEKYRMSRQVDVINPKGTEKIKDDDFLKTHHAMLCNALRINEFLYRIIIVCKCR